MMDKRDTWVCFLKPLIVFMTETIESGQTMKKNVTIAQQIMRVAVATGFALSPMPVNAKVPQKYLTSAELKALLPGKQIVEGNDNGGFEVTQHFLTDGVVVKYISQAISPVQSKETYRIVNDEFCVTDQFTKKRHPDKLIYGQYLYCAKLTAVNENTYLQTSYGKDRMQRSSTVTIRSMRRK